MKTCWPSSVCVFFTVLCAVHATYHSQSAYRCICNGKARYCRADALGLYCVDCQHNTTGRHCESCKDAHYHQRAGESCSPCHCNPIGSAGPNCDSRGQCSCRLGAAGSRCDLCPDGRAVTAEGCDHSRGQQEQADQPSAHQCFCYGHSSSCSQTSGYSVYNISSSFENGTEGWRAAAPPGVSTSDIHFRWSPKYQDLEVISKHSLPVYLYAPSCYLGDQVLSYGQNLSFSLRLDRGVRYPSTSDVVLEGSGLRVSAALGELRSIVPSGHTLTYTFRLDERVGSKWKPQLSSTQFQTLLHNLTALKIRASFGQDGRGYLDNVNMVSARRGNGGVPATWAWQCRCPEGYVGERCERCAAGFKRAEPGAGAFGRCQACRCAGGCDSETGECFSADQSDAGQGCSPGYYSNAERLCVKCPCPHGVNCSVTPRSLKVTCDPCPPGTSGSHCHVCESGFYGDPQGLGGQPRPCRPCQCNGHVDACDRVTGACLQCNNNTRGQHCESCVEGYHHTHTHEECTLCKCSVQGSVSVRCSDRGQCVCREGYEGLRCQRSSCPACFDPITTKVEGYAEKLQELEKMLSAGGGGGGGGRPGVSAQMERTLREAERSVTQLQENADALAEMEKGLQGRLSIISKDQLAQGHALQGVADAADGVEQRRRAYRTRVSTVQSLIEEMRSKLAEASASIQSADIPRRDVAPGSDGLSSLVDKATQLADTHQQQAEEVEQSAGEALSDSQQSLALLRTLMNRENHVKQLIAELKDMYDRTSFQVKALENQASQVSVEAADESSMAKDMMTQIHTLETTIPDHLQEEVQDLLSGVEELEEQVNDNITASQSVQDDVQEVREELEERLVRGKAARNDYERNLARVNAAKAETDAALKIINDKHRDVIHTLNTLRGFDENMGVLSAEADAAIARLPAINATVRRAVDSNARTLSTLNAVSQHFLDAQGSQDRLRTLTTTLEGMCVSLPPHGDLANDATTLNLEVQGLLEEAESAEEKLTVELNHAETQRQDAEEASLAASGSHTQARDTREAVSTTLQAVNNLLSVIGQPGSVDEARLEQLENALGDARSQVIGQLKPRLQQMEEEEAGQRSRLAALNADIDGILRDITNVEDILRTIPEGCYNSLPQEHA